MPKLWVYYTNHRGERRWREIERVYDVGVEMYPPTAPVRRSTMCMTVKLGDRTGKRTLALTSCHAFVESEMRPVTNARAFAPAPAPLMFEELTQANADRQKVWDRDGKLVGPLGTLYRANELGGEVGELQNKVKKWVRQQLGIDGSRTNLSEIADELADCVICLDLLAADLGISLGGTVRRKFNETSMARNFDTRL